MAWIFIGYNVIIKMQVHTQKQVSGATVNLTERGSRTLRSTRTHYQSSVRTCVNTCAVRYVHSDGSPRGVCWKLTYMLLD